MSTPGIVEKVKALTDLGNGLLARVYLMKSKLQTDSKRDLYLGGEEMKKLRYILVKKFPHVPSISKLEARVEDGGIAGGQRFLSNAVNTCRVLSSYRDLVYDIVDFSVTSSRLLVDIPAMYILEFSLEQNRELCVLYMDLLCIYMRVAIFFSSMHDEGFSMYAMYAAACHYLQINSSRGDTNSQFFGNLGNLDEKYTENIVILFDEHLRDTQRHFIELFQPISKTLKGMLLQMRRSIYLAHDLDSLNSEGVREYVYRFVVCLEGYISVLLLSCSTTTGALGSPDLLPPCHITTMSLHITIILIITHLSTSLHLQTDTQPSHRRGAVKQRQSPETCFLI